MLEIKITERDSIRHSDVIVVNDVMT